VVSLLTPRELAERLNVSVDTVYRHAGEWPCVRIGPVLRFDYEQVLDHLQQERETAH
jgi:excisionase family DNA binding protein